MQGDKKVIDHLNKQLASELAAISQYIVHSEMCSNWGYEELSTYIKGRAKDEMRHAEMLIERIIFLEGKPIVSKPDPINIGARVQDMFTNDHEAEEGAIESYNEAIKACVDAGDNGTRKILEQILSEEEDHIDVIEQNQAQISMMGLPAYLVEQV